MKMCPVWSITTILISFMNEIICIKTSRLVHSNSSPIVFLDKRELVPCNLNQIPISHLNRSEALVLHYSIPSTFVN